MQQRRHHRNTIELDGKQKSKTQQQSIKQEQKEQRQEQEKEPLIMQGPLDPNSLELSDNAESSHDNDLEPLASSLDNPNQRRRDANIRHWKESPFAVGLVNKTWADEKHPMNVGPSPPDQSCLCCSVYVCSCLGAGRVGNMAVLKQTTEWVEEEVIERDEDDNDEEQQATKDTTESSGKEEPRTRRHRFTRPKLVCVLGPYWPMLLFVTYPLILGVSCLTWFRGLPGKPWLLQVVWTVATSMLIYSLAMTAFRDPGILYKHEQPPPRSVDWKWSDVAQTYRPRGAFYDPDCAVVVEEFDHTCPWTGTAIGKKNMSTFQCFVGLIFVCLVLDIFLLTLPLPSK